MSAKISFLPNAATANRVLSGVPIRSIAIVDDEECVCRAFARLLRAYSYHPQTYRSATEFLQALNEGVPDCLILDVHLGDMNGFDFLRRLTVAVASAGATFLSLKGRGQWRPGWTASLSDDAKTRVLSSWDCGSDRIAEFGGRSDRHRLRGDAGFFWCVAARAGTHGRG